MYFIRHKGLTVNMDFLGFLQKHNLASFGSLMDFEGGEVIKKRGGRSVVRVQLDWDGKKRCFYLKRHYRRSARGVKGLLRFPGAAEDGKNEWEKTLLLWELGFPTAIPVVFAEYPPRSLTLTEEIYGAVRVEDYIPTLSSRLKGFDGVIEKRALVERLAAFAKRFHGKGLHHQDFYLGHFFMRPSSGELFILDVQRVQKKKDLPERCILKDLAQIVFSAKNTGNFSSTDLVRFGHGYLEKDKFNEEDKRLVRRILSKSRRIARHTVKLLARRRKEGR